ncbi:DUF1330 domain-containing protein [Alphaproteobacteria bacterium LSUCC0684]
MPKGYLVANIRVNDKDKFQNFSGMAGPVIQKFGGRVLARGPGADRHEGSLSGVVMMIEFESKEVAEKFYFSDEYQAAKAVRDECADTDLMIIEGAE